MGSRAVVVVCRDDGRGAAAVRRRRRGLRRRATRAPAAASSTTPRSERAFLDARPRRGAAAGLLDELETRLAAARLRADAVVGEGAGAAARAVRGGRRGRRAALAERSPRSSRPRRAASELRSRALPRPRLDDVARYIDAYRRYCWPVTSLADLQARAVPPAGQRGRACTSTSRTRWHMEHAATGSARPTTRAASRDRARRRSTRPIPRARRAAVAWWEELTDAGGEGMVVKPLDFVARGRRGLVQPAVKCRGREYLRIIYGPEYTEPENLERLRQRGLGAQALARAARVRARRRGAGAVRPRRAAAPRPRVRVRRARAGERAGRSAAVTSRAI